MTSATIRAPIRAVQWLLRALVSVAVLVVLLRLQDSKELAATASRLQWPWLAAGLLVLAAQIPLNAWRWSAILAALEAQKVPLPVLTGTTGLALLGEQMMLPAIGADVVRVGTLSRRVGVAVALRSVLVDRTLGLAVLALLACLGAVGLAGLGHTWEALWLPIGLGIALAVGAASVGFCAPRLAAWRWVPHFLSDALRDLRRLTGVACRTKIVLQSCLIHGATLAALGCVALAMRLSVADTASILLVAPSVVLLALVPVSLGGWGVREAAMVFALGPLGVPADQALVVSVLFGLMLLAQALCGGALWLASGLRR